MIDDHAIDYEALEAEALAADPDMELDDDAVSFWDVTEGRNGRDSVPLLPEWYATAPMGRREPLTGWRRRVALLIIVSFVAINAYGLCSTYGQVVLA